MNNKTIALTVAVVILILAVLGLSISMITNDDSPKSSDTPSNTTRPTETPERTLPPTTEVTPEPTPEAPSPTAEVNPALDEAFADSARAQIPSLNSIPDKNIGDMARALCQFFDSNGMTNATLNEAVGIVVSSTGGLFTPKQAAFFAGMSVGAYCPQHTAALQNLADNGA